MNKYCCIESLVIKSMHPVKFWWINWHYFLYCYSKWELLPWPGNTIRYCDLCAKIWHYAAGLKLTYIYDSIRVNKPLFYIGNFATLFIILLHTSTLKCINIFVSSKNNTYFLQKKEYSSYKKNVIIHS